MTEYLQDRFRGVMLGLACGDALGAQVEFMQRGTFPKQRDMTGGGPHRLAPGQWTDDTAMALHLAEHLVTDPEVKHLNILADRWLAWRDQGIGSCTGRCFDIGTQTSHALDHWKNLGTPPKHDSRRRGNGALMRVAPVALAQFNDPDKVMQAAYQQAIVTHSEGGGLLCAKFTALLRSMMGQPSSEMALGTLRLYNPTIIGRRARLVDSSGYDLATYEAAVWAVGNSETIEKAIIRAVNLGDDADTVGAVTGALAGAIWGAQALPERWTRKLAWGDKIIAMADRLYARIQEAK